MSDWAQLLRFREVALATAAPAVPLVHGAGPDDDEDDEEDDLDRKGGGGGDIDPDDDEGYGEDEEDDDDEGDTLWASRSTVIPPR